LIAILIYERMKIKDHLIFESRFVVKMFLWFCYYLHVFCFLE